MQTDRQRWRGQIRDLYRSIHQLDAIQDLLRDIDRAILTTAPSEIGAVETVFLNAMKRVSDIFRLSHPGAFYVDTGRALVRLEDKDYDGPQRLLPDSPAVQAFRAGRLEPTVLARDLDMDPLLAEMPEAACLRLEPLRAHDALLGLVLFADGADFEGSPLGDEDFARATEAVVQQLSIAYNHRDRELHDGVLNEVWSLFLEKELGPTDCLRLLAHRIPDFMPSFGPFALSVRPEVQILVPIDGRPDEVPRFLTIRATTGAEAPITKVAVNSSISGLLVEQAVEDLPYFCGDPREPRWKGRYKSYLAEADDAPIRTELVVRLLSSDGSIIGLLNLESPAAEAFNPQHCHALLDLAPTIAPMVEAFDDRIRHNMLMQRSVAATTSIYLDTVASIFRHAIGTPLLTLSTNVDLVRDTDVAPPSTAAIEEREHALTRLRAVSEEIRTYAVDFTRDISGFSEMGAFSLRTVLDESASLIRRSMLVAAPEDIRIDVKGPRDAYGFCSGLFKQHLFSLMSNAVYSVRDRMASEAEPRPGVISIILEESDSVPDGQEIELNRRWLIRIRDNGTGVTPEQLASLKKFEPGTRYRKSPGHGLGLMAARRYMSSINGWIDLGSEPGRFFEVRLMLDRYRDDVHGAQSTRPRFDDSTTPMETHA